LKADRLAGVFIHHINRRHEWDHPNFNLNKERIAEEETKYERKHFQEAAFGSTVRQRLFMFETYLQAALKAATLGLITKDDLIKIRQAAKEETKRTVDCYNGEDFVHRHGGGLHRDLLVATKEVVDKASDEIDAALKVEWANQIYY